METLTTQPATTAKIDFDPSFVGVILSLVAFLAIAYLFGRFFIVSKVDEKDVVNWRTITNRLKHTRRLSRRRFCGGDRMSWHRGSNNSIRIASGQEIEAFRFASLTWQRIFAIALLLVVAFLLATQYRVVSYHVGVQILAEGANFIWAPHLATCVLFSVVIFAEYLGIMEMANFGATAAALTYGRAVVARGHSPRFYERRSLSRALRDDYQSRRRVA